MKIQCDDAYILNFIGTLLYEGRRATLTNYTIPQDRIEETVSVVAARLY